MTEPHRHQVSIVDQNTGNTVLKGSVEAIGAIGGMDEATIAEINETLDERDQKVSQLVHTVIEAAIERADKVSSPIVETMAACGFGPQTPDVQRLVIQARQISVDKALEGTPFMRSESGEIVVRPGARL